MSEQTLPNFSDTPIHINEDELLVEQLLRYEEIKAGDDTICVFEVRPSAEKLKSETPIVIGPGFLQGGEDSRELMFRLAQFGWHVISFRARNGIDRADIPELNGGGYHLGQQRKAAALLTVLDAKGINEAYYLGKSEGAVYGLIAADAQPDKFAGMILTPPISIKNGPGMIGRLAAYSLLESLGEGMRDSWYDLKGGCPQWIERIYGKPGVVSGSYNSAWSRSEHGDCLRDNAKNIEDKLSWSRVLQAVAGIAATGFVPLLRRAKANGIDVIMVAGVEHGFSNREIQRYVKAEDVRGLYTVHGGHFVGNSFPKKFAELIDHSFAILEAEQYTDIEDKAEAT